MCIVCALNVAVWSPGTCRLAVWHVLQVLEGDSASSIDLVSMCALARYWAVAMPAYILVACIYYFVAYHALYLYNCKPLDSLLNLALPPGLSTLSEVQSESPAYISWAPLI